MRTTALLAGVAVLASTGPAFAQEKVYSGLDTSDLDALATVLRKQVVYLEVIEQRRESPLSAAAPSGYGAAIEADLVVALSHLVKNAKHITLRGPTGKMSGKVVLLDPIRRVALIRTEKPVQTIGLEVVRLAPTDGLLADSEVFALVSTDDHAGVVQGVITHTGELAEYEGHPRIDILLHQGMPVFDNRARMIGYSRVVAWDVDKHMIIPYRKIVSARTSTGAAARPPEAKKPARPWWAR